jgi:hypothetical protein
MLDHVVVDVEIARTVESCTDGWNSTEEMGVAVACVWEYRTSRMRVYGPLELTTLQDRLLAADRISGYNIWKFDFPVIWGISRTDWMQRDSLRNIALKADLGTQDRRSPPPYMEGTRSRSKRVQRLTQGLGTGRRGWLHSRLPQDRLRRGCSEVVPGRTDPAGSELLR